MDLFMTFEMKKDNVYEQIVMEYKRLISLNILTKGDKLPSCRDLAREKGINPNTVSKAYTCLEDQGYIEAIPKKGVYVIFDSKANNNDDLIIEINRIKENNINYETLIEIVNKVYGR